MGCLFSITTKTASLLFQSDGSIQFDIKLILLGDPGVGKSAIVYRYLQNTFNESYEQTFGACLLKKHVKLDDNRLVDINIWDTGGQERFKSLMYLYYKSANAAIITYDSCNENSLNSCEYWIQELKKSEVNCILILVGNKCDIENDDKRIKKSTIKKFVAKHGIKWMETSARTGQGIQELFDHLINETDKTLISSKVLN